MTAFLDELAKDLARPMSRSRALRLLGGSAIVATFSPLVPKSARAGRRQETGCFFPQGCAKTARCCYDQKSGKAASCCPFYIRCTSNGRCGEQFTCPDFRDFCGPFGSKKCCGPNEICFKGGCLTPCPPTQQLCGELCCPKGTECVTLFAGPKPYKTCLPKCPGGRARCGAQCCGPNLKCVNPKTGLCKPCGPGQEQCGSKCCDKATSFCADPANRLCCPKKSSSCPTGPVTAPKRTCCKRPNRCARELPPTIGGLTASSPYVCCPPERVVPASGGALVCCAKGQVSLGGKFLVGSGVQGFCCDKDQLCGPKGDPTCCQTFSANIGTDLNQTCCNGACKTLNYDPENCGRCGRRCAAGQRCARGTCVPA